SRRSTASPTAKWRRSSKARNCSCRAHRCRRRATRSSITPTWSGSTCGCRTARISARCARCTISARATRLKLNARMASHGALHQGRRAGGRYRGRLHRARSAGGIAGQAMTAWTATVLTLFPDMFPGPLAHSLAGKARDAGIWSLVAVDIRNFADDKHRTVDDTPFGGGPGMVMRPDVVDRAIAGTSFAGPLLYLSPRGKRLEQARVRELASGPGIALLCGRFEGIDQRVIEAR